MANRTDGDKIKLKKTTFGLAALIIVPLFFLIGLWIGNYVITQIKDIAELQQTAKGVIKYAIAVAGGVVGLALTAPLYSLLQRIASLVERGLVKYSSKEILMGIIGMLMGVGLAVLIAALVGFPDASDWTRIIFNVCIGLLLGYIGLRIGSRILYDVLPATNLPRQAKLSGSSNPSVIVADTSALIDGRILDVVRTGFITGMIIIPNDVLKELNRIADNADELKRNRGRRGLDIVAGLQKEKNVSVKVVEPINQPKDVETAVIQAAQEACARVITSDSALAKFAIVHSIEVLNMNDLSNAIKPIALPGEKMKLKVTKLGKEKGQGVAFAPDGTMIVVENGGDAVGQEVEAVVMTSLQTSSGRIIFTRIPEDSAK